MPRRGSRRGRGPDRVPRPLLRGRRPPRDRVRRHPVPASRRAGRDDGDACGCRSLSCRPSSATSCRSRSRSARATSRPSTGSEGCREPGTGAERAGTPARRGGVDQPVHPRPDRDRDAAHRRGRSRSPRRTCPGCGCSTSPTGRRSVPRTRSTTRPTQQGVGESVPLSNTSVQERAAAYVGSRPRPGSILAWRLAPGTGTPDGRTAVVALTGEAELPMIGPALRDLGVSVRISVRLPRPSRRPLTAENVVPPWSYDRPGARLADPGARSEPS